IRSGIASTALVIGAETFSRILDWNDRGTCVLFGDGAGAIVLRGEEGRGTSSDRGVLANAVHCDGRQHDILYVDGGPSATRAAVSIPLALDTAVKDGRIKRGDLLLLEGIGGGLAWGASLVRW